MIKKLLLFCCCFSQLWLHAQAPVDFVIPIKITVNEQLPAITLSWPVNTDAVSYTIKRKTVTANSYAAAFTSIGTISNAVLATSFTDNSVSAGVSYEYEVVGSFSPTLPATRGNFVCAGINIPPVHHQGSIVLLCESGIAATIDDRLATLYKDLVGEGWKVIRIYVPASNDGVAVKSVKDKIIAAYQGNPDLKQVLIIGHVPVPYSGNLDPDGHSEHNGCWPADGYYGDMTGTWTDTITSNTLAGARPQNKNFPGDGKFDQSNLASVQLAVGRVDFINLPAFGITETDLLKRYLDKNHLFRYGETQLQKRALIEDGFLSFTEKFSQSAWKSFAANVGYDNVKIGQYETDLLSPAGYLWSYGCGAGVYNGASGISYTSDFVNKSHKTVFTQLFGSYFGDWDSQDNLMRASIASAGNTLACVWGGRPHWYFHHMSTGWPIGYAELLTMNNKNAVYANPGNANAMVHIGLMGDPSLKSSYVKPVKNVAAIVNGNHIDISWSKPIETNIAGYYIYRGNSMNGAFTLLNQTAISDTTIVDTLPLTGNNVYMVRTLRIDTVVTVGEYTNNSTFSNLAAGTFAAALFNRIIPIPAPVLSLRLIDQLLVTSSPNQVIILGDTSKRFIVGDKNGLVQSFDDSFNLTGTYLTVPNFNDGFFSMAFHPGFKKNKLLYLLFTNTDGNMELAKYREDSSSNMAVFVGTMLTIPLTGNSRNIGGELHFGPDDNLYISTGDGDDSLTTLNNAQNKSSLLGRILRITPDTTDIPPHYTIPADNPFGNEVFAMGLQFPYRWDIDVNNKNVWIGDRSFGRVEEINRISFASLNGANFGWPCFIGSDTFNTTDFDSELRYNFPVYQFPSPADGGAVTGGTVYRGETFMSLEGYYIFADSRTGKVYFSKYDSLSNAYITSSQILSPSGISDISEDSNGELYVTSVNGGVYRLESEGPRRYRFTGNGNWDNPNNWFDKTIPPAVLPAGSEIIISPVSWGECVLNVPQTIPVGSKIMIGANKRFKITGNLTSQ